MQEWNEAHVVSPFSDASDDPESANGSSGFFSELVYRSKKHSRLHVYLRAADDLGEIAYGDRTTFEKLARSVDLRIHVVPPIAARALHAKLFALRVGQQWNIFIGSANATEPGMTLTSGNVEVGWSFEQIGTKLPTGIMPKAPGMKVSSVQFKRPKITFPRRWDALEAAVYSPVKSSLRLSWLDGYGPKNTRVLLGRREIDPKNVDLAKVPDRYLETRRRPAQQGIESGFVPIQMPSTHADEHDAYRDLSPEQWLEVLANGAVLFEEPDMDAASALNGSAATKGSPAAGKLAFHWRQRCQRFYLQLQSLVNSIKEAQSAPEFDSLARCLQGSWMTHDPEGGETEEEWARWVRAGLWQALGTSVLDGRKTAHRPLCQLRDKWRTKVKKDLREFPIV